MSANNSISNPDPHGRIVTRRRALIAAMAASSAALSLTVPERGRQTTVAFPKPDLQPETGSPVPELDDALLDEVIVQLARAGVAVYATPDAPTPVIDVSDPGPVSLLANQMWSMVSEAIGGSGILGHDLDALVSERNLLGAGDQTIDQTPQMLVVDDRVVIPPSLLVASYIQTTDTPGAMLIRGFRPDISIERATTQLIPSLGLMLFAAEIAREHGPGVAVTPGGVRALLPPGAQGGICTQAQGFIDSTINQLFSALMVDLGPSPAGAILGSIINGVILGFRLPLQAAIASLTKPVLDVIRDIAGVLAIAATVVSTIRPWTLRLTAAPAATRLAIGSEPGLPGKVELLVDLGGLDEWPTDVADCALASGVPLPPLKPVNARCSWLVTGSRLNLVQSDLTPPQLDANAKATLTYHTLSESEDDAKGDPVTGIVIVTATVARPDVDDLKRTLVNLLFAQLPDVLNQFVRPYLGPVVDQLLGKVASLTDSVGRVSIPVIYHEPPKRTPTPEPEPSEGTGASLDFMMEPLFPTSGPGAALTATISVSVASCDGDAWSGRIGLDYHVDSEAFEIDAGGESPVEWDFAEGDQATATVGPFEGTIVIPPVTSSPISYTFDLTITRSRDAELDGAVSLAFDVVLHSTFFGSSETVPLEQFTNLGVPIPVESGGADCDA